MGETRGRIVVMTVLAVVAVSMGGLIGASTATPPRSSPVATPDPTAAVSLVVETYAVHVSGMVVSPGVVHVSSDAIVADAVEAAGGLRPDAQADRINLAAPVVPGDQIIVPGPDSAGDFESGESGDGGPISLNRATAAELETLPGVGAVLAGRIVAHRDANGRFESVEDLLDVSGIGEAKLAAIRDLIRP